MMSETEGFPQTTMDTALLGSNRILANTEEQKMMIQETLLLSALTLSCSWGTVRRKEILEVTQAYTYKH